MHDGRTDLTLIQDLRRDSHDYAHETQASSNNFESATMVVDGPSVEVCHLVADNDGSNLFLFRLHPKLKPSLEEKKNN